MHRLRKHFATGNHSWVRLMFSGRFVGPLDGGRARGSRINGEYG